MPTNCFAVILRNTLNSSHSSNTAAYCKARQRLSLELIKMAAINTGHWLDRNSPDRWKWLGRQVKLIDATTVTMPDTEDNQKQYPQISGQKKGIGFPIARISAIVSLESGAILDAEIGNYHTSEHRLFLAPLVSDFA